jgi:type I restriction enzyme M protein
MNQDLRQKLDRMIDKFRTSGSFDPVTCIEQISYLIFLKLLDEEETERELPTSVGTGDGKSKPLFSVQSARYRWKNWHLKSGSELRDYIRDEVFPYMASLGKSEPEVAEYFRDAELEIADPKVLKDVIDGLEGLEINLLGLDVKGDVFEYLIDHLGSGSLNGQFRTPPQIRAFMVEMVDPGFGDTIFDPACGTGGFLIDAVDHLLNNYPDDVNERPTHGEDWSEKKGESLADRTTMTARVQTFREGADESAPSWDLLEASIYGTDVSRQMIRIAMMNLMLHGVRHSRIKRANPLIDMGGLTEDDMRRKYKVILSNPPMADQQPKDSIRDDLPSTSRKSELIFVSLMMRHLAPGGRCAVIVPEGLLFGSTRTHVELRTKLVDEFDVLAVISLPAGVFKPHTGIKTSVLLFRKPLSKSEARPSNVWFYEIRKDGAAPRSDSGDEGVEQPEKGDIPDLIAQWNIYSSNNFVLPPGEAAKTLLEADRPEPSSWWAARERLAEEGFNLQAAHWKPTVAEKVNHEDPRILVSEMLDDYRKVVEGLEKLMKELAE